MSHELYYVQNVERGYVGNSVQWWKWNDNGYTCDVRAAKKFDLASAEQLCESRSKYKMWPVEQIDSLVQHHVDMQDLRYGSTVPHTIADLASLDRETDNGTT